MAAANAIDSGMCDIALVTSAESLRSLSGFQRLFSFFKGGMTALFAAGGHREFEAPYGPTVISGYAMYAIRMMAEYCTTREQMAQVAVSIRKHATMHPQAQKREELSMSEMLSGRHSPRAAEWGLRSRCPIRGRDNRPR